MTSYLNENCEGWSIGYQHGADMELLCFDEWTYQVGEAEKHFAIPLMKDAHYLAFYDKVATKALSDPDEWHPVAKHLPETMSIEFGVMYH